MSERTLISWTKATWNPWHGCTKVSEGCDNCYMFTAKRRYGQDPEKVVRSKTKFRDPLKWDEGKLIFTCSWSDWFHKDADPWRDEAWEIIRRTPHHTYQILTKRPGRIHRHLPADWGEGYPNVWLGVTVENQASMYRVRQLSNIPAHLRFLSCEPMLSALDFGTDGLNRIDWAIPGGESGPGFRMMDLAWLESFVAQCRAADVPIWVKQDSAPLTEQRGRIPDHLWIQEMPVGAGLHRGIDE